jgi:peptidoglycan hydrolase CwlO-like protein
MPTNIDTPTINSYTQLYHSATNTTGDLDLSGLASSVYMTPSNITLKYNDTEQEEYIEKLEKHIDELEEDIEYINKQLQEKDDKIEYLMHRVDQLESDSANMNSRLIYLESRLISAGGQSK